MLQQLPRARPRLGVAQHHGPHEAGARRRERRGERPHQASRDGRLYLRLVPALKGEMACDGEFFVRRCKTDSYEAGGWQFCAIAQLVLEKVQGNMSCLVWSFLKAGHLLGARRE